MAIKIEIKKHGDGVNTYQFKGKRDELSKANIRQLLEERHIPYNKLWVEPGGKYYARIPSGIIDDPQTAARWIAKQEAIAGRKQTIGTPLQTAAPSTPSHYEYEAFVDKKEQIADIRKWAESRGATVERRYAGSREEAEEFAKKGIPIRIMSGEQLPEKLEINIRAPEQISRERSEQLARVAGKKVYEEATLGEKIDLHVHTALSTKGYEYVGAAARESARAQPYNIPAQIAGVAMDTVFPGIKGTRQVVEENLSAKIARHSRGEYSYTYEVPLIGKVAIDDRIVDAISNPVVDVELMALGGAGAAKVAATKVGAKVFASTAGKIALTAGGAVYVGSKGYEIHALRESGESTKALGTAITTAAGLVAGVTAFKAQTAHILKYQVPNDLKVDLSKIKGASVTEKRGDVTLSKGRFQVAKGKLKGLHGKVYSVTQKKDGGLVVKIPSQKVGGHKIKAETFMRHTHAGKTVKVGTSKVYTTITKEGRVLIDTGKGKPVKGPLVGRHVDKTYMKEIAKVMKIGTDRTGKQHNFVIRKLEGIGIGKSSHKHNLYLVKKGHQMALVESKSGLVKPRVAKIDWIDIAKIGPAKGSIHVIKPGPGGFFAKTVPKAGTTPSIKSIAVPPASVAVKVGPSLGARIVPVVNPVPTGIRIKHQPKPEQTQRIVAEPMIIRRDTQKPTGRIVTPIQEIRSVVPKIERAIEGVRVKYTPVAQSYHPITGQEVTGKQATVLRQQLEPIIDRIAPQPVPVVPVQPGKKPGGLFGPGLIPFLRLTDAKADLKSFKIGVIKNPVPDIEKVI